MDRVLEFHALFAWSAYGRPLTPSNFLFVKVSSRFGDARQGRGAVVKRCLWTPCIYQKPSHAFLHACMHAFNPQTASRPHLGIRGHGRSFQTVTCPPMTQIFGAVYPRCASGEMGRVWGGLTTGERSLPPDSMNRASPRPVLENGPRNGAYFWPQFLPRAFLGPQTGVWVCGENNPRNARFRHRDRNCCLELTKA